MTSERCEKYCILNMHAKLNVKSVNLGLNGSTMTVKADANLTPVTGE